MAHTSLAQVQQLLDPKSKTQERVKGLMAVGLDAKDIADVVGISASGVRNWTRGAAEPRGAAQVALDDLRATVKVFLDAAYDIDHIVPWLKSRNPSDFANERPITAVTTNPMMVLAAAHREALKAASASGSRQAPVRAAG